MIVAKIVEYVAGTVAIFDPMIEGEIRNNQRAKGHGILCIKDEMRTFGGGAKWRGEYENISCITSTTHADYIRTETRIHVCLFE